MTKSLPRVGGRLIVGVLCSLLALNGAIPAGAASVRPRPLFNPTSNILPVPDFLSSGAAVIANGVATYTNPCLSPGSLTWPVVEHTTACDQYVLSAINTARARLHEPAMVLPSNWSRLSEIEQLFVAVNLERLGLGYPAYVGLSLTLNGAAQFAAARGNDPNLVDNAQFRVAYAHGVPLWGGAWAGGFSPLSADYVWMYDDGWAGSRTATSNVACTSAHAGGCWGHRDELLGSDPGYNPGVGLGCRTCVVGAGFAIIDHGTASSFSMLIERPAGRVGPLYFSWRRELTFLRGAVHAPPTSTSTTTNSTLP